MDHKESSNTICFNRGKYQFDTFNIDSTRIKQDHRSGTSKCPHYTNCSKHISYLLPSSTRLGRDCTPEYRCLPHRRGNFKVNILLSPYCICRYHQAGSRQGTKCKFFLKHHKSGIHFRQYNLLEHVYEQYLKLQLRQDRLESFRRDKHCPNKRSLLRLRPVILLKARNLPWLS